MYVHILIKIILDMSWLYFIIDIYVPSHTQCIWAYINTFIQKHLLKFIIHKVYLTINRFQTGC